MTDTAILVNLSKVVTRETKVVIRRQRIELTKSLVDTRLVVMAFLISTMMR